LSPRRPQRPRRLDAALRSVTGPLAPRTPLAAVQGAWREAAGDGIATHARPVSERDGVVTVACDAATWAQELDLLQDELLDRLAATLGDRAPRGLRFVVGTGRYDDPV
jgi:predicted nucleic acid-binding Zn ribbon protein